MSNLGPLAGGNARQLTVPTPPRGESIARYDTYLEAQRAVDYLSDNHFPVQSVTIVGTDLRMVERVTGRLTYGRVAVAGAASGAWFGLFVGLLLSLFAQGGSGLTVIPAVLIGAGFGMFFGVISYAFTRGRRDFTSTSQIVASEYQVLCLDEHADRAVEMLQGLPGGTGRGAAAPRPAGVAAEPAEPAEPEQPGVPVTGPTYGEMIDKQRREREERERSQSQPPA